MIKPSEINNDGLPVFKLEEKGTQTSFDINDDGLPILKKNKKVNGKSLETGSEETLPFSLRGMTAIASTVTGDITEPVSKNPYSNVLNAIAEIDIPQEQKNLIYSEATTGNARPLVDVVKAEREKSKQKKKELASFSLTGANGSFVQVPDFIIKEDNGIPATELQDEDDIKLKRIQTSAAKVIDNAAADKLLSLYGTNLTDNAKEIGKERRMLLSEIGEETGFKDELGAVDYVEGMKSKVLYGFMPLGIRVNEAEVDEAHNYKNEIGAYSSALSRLDEELTNLSKTENLQAFINGTPEQREAMKSDPVIQDFHNKASRFEFLQNTAESLAFKYPQVLRQLQKQKIADAWADKISKQQEGAAEIKDPTYQVIMQAIKLFKGDKPDTETEYQELADATGIDVERVKEITESQDLGGAIVIPSRLGMVWRSAVGVTQSTSQGLNRLLLDKDKANVINQEIQETIYETPEVLRKKWTADRVFDTMANGLGQFIGYVGTAGTVSAPVSAITGAITKAPAIINAVEKAANIGSTFAAGYTSSLESSYQYAATQTDNEEERWEYAKSVAAANGASELLLRDIDIASKILKGKSATKILQEVAAKKTPFGVADVFKARMGEFAKVIGYETAEELIPFATELLQKENVLGYKTSTSEMLKGAFDTVIETAISTIPMGGFSSISVSSTRVMEAALYEAAKTPDQFKERFEQLYQDGVSTETERDKNIQLVNTLQDILPTIPNEIDGRQLGEPEKASLLNSILGKRQLQQYKKEVDSSFHGKVDEKIKNIDEQINNIVTPKEETPTETEAVLTDQEKSTQKTQEELTGEATAVSEAQPQIRTTEDIDKLFGEKLPYEMKYQQIEFSDPATGIVDNMSATKARKQMQKRHETLEKLLNCIG